MAYIGHYLIDIEKELKEEDFKSGRCFIEDLSNNNISVKPAKKKMAVKIKPRKKFQDVTQFHHKVPTSHDDCIVLCKPGDREEMDSLCFIEEGLAKELMPHQVEGVKFMFECVTGLRENGLEGCILADSMGLGKTLQVITLM